MTKNTMEPNKSRLETLKSTPQELTNLGPTRLVVDIEKIIPDPANERKQFPGIEELAASIKKFGMLEPVIVSANGDGTFKLLIGERRLRANKVAGLNRIEILIRDPEEESSRRIKSLISNIQRQNLSPLELAVALKDRLAQDETIKTQRVLAEAIGKDEQWVSGILKVLSLAEHLQKKLGRAQVSYDSVIKIARIADPKVQEQLIDELLAGATHGQMREQIQKLQGKSGSPSLKPKKGFNTKYEAKVIVQSTTSHRLTDERVVNALKEALTQARKGQSA